MKLSSARSATEVAMEAVQLFGGNGYMAEYQVEQLARDVKALQIYAGTDKIQITDIARNLFRQLAMMRSARTVRRLSAMALTCDESFLGKKKARKEILRAPYGNHDSRSYTPRFFETALI
jgi:plasmid maintenance system killer protein